MTDPDAFPELIFEAPRLDVVGDLRDAPDDVEARATYTEDDWVAEVEILEDRSTPEREAYLLRVVRTTQPSRSFRPVPDGSEFECSQLRRFAGSIYTIVRV